MREIEVETFLQPMGEGISRPVLVVGDDFNEYILKNQKVDQNGNTVNYDCMFVNELLAYQIGCYLDVPMPDTVIALVDQAFIDSDPSIRFAYKFERGKYFATQKLPYVENNLEDNYKQLASMRKPYRKNTWKQFFDKISNKEDISNILVFDLLVGNFDRYSNSGNILINRGPQRKMYAIDHGHAFFGPVWSQEKIGYLRRAAVTIEYINWYVDFTCQFIPGSMYNALEENIHLEDVTNHSFMNVMEKISKIDENMIELWMNNIPDEWYVSKELQVVYYKNYLLTQKQVLHYIIQLLANREVFTNYKGGDLEWNHQKQKSHTV